jgi:hypothetical protein
MNHTSSILRHSLWLLFGAVYAVEPVSTHAAELVLENPGLKNTYRFTFREIEAGDSAVEGMIEIFGDESNRREAHTRLPFFGSIEPIEGRDDAEKLTLSANFLLSFSAPQDREQPVPVVTGTLYGRESPNPGARIGFFQYDSERGEWRSMPFDFGAVPESEPGVEEDGMSQVRIGPLFLGMGGAAVKAALETDWYSGEPVFEAATGLTVREWIAPGVGLSLKVGSAGDDGAALVESIEVIAPSDLRTDRDIGLGSTREEVESAYAAEIDRGNREAAAGGELVAGSVCGGVIFSFDDSGRVSRIFAGAAAE